MEHSDTSSFLQLINSYYYSDVFRTKDDEKLSPTSTMNPHDSGYESGTVRSRRDLQLMSKSHDFGYESATLMRPNKRDLASAPKTRDSSFGGGTMMRPKRETALAASSDFATLKRVKKSPTLSVQSRYALSVYILQLRNLLNFCSILTI